MRGRRQQREAFSAFQGLIATPHDLTTGPLVMPAGARLALSHDSALTLGEVTISIVPGRVGFSHPAMSADVVHKGDWAAERTQVEPADAPTGTLRLYVVNPLDGTTHVIAELAVA